MNFIKNIAMGLLNDVTNVVKNSTLDIVRHNLGITISYPQIILYNGNSISNIINDWVNKKIPKNNKNLQMSSTYNDNKLGIRVGINRRDTYNIKLDKFTRMIYEPLVTIDTISGEGDIVKGSISRLTIIGANYGLHYAKLCKYIDSEIKRLNNTTDVRKSINITTLASNNTNANIEVGRSLDTVYGEHVKKMINGVRGWEMSKKVYEDLEIPYKLGILLLGPPGTGKTSSIKALATEIDASITSLSPSLLKDPDNLHIRLSRIMSINGNKILLLEDIDRIIIEHKKSVTDTTDIVGTLLNLLDGINCLSGVIVIATANEVHELPEAMIRPGRFDLVINVDGIKGDDVLRLVSRYKIKSMNIDLEYIKNHPIGCYNEETGLYNPSKVQNILMGIKTQESIKGIK